MSYTADETTNPRETQNIIQTNAVEIYAGFWKRFAAWVLDFIIVTICSTFMGFMTGILFGVLGLINLESPSADLQLQFLGWLVTFLFAWSYYVSMEASEHQGTLGKMAMNIKVTDENGDRITSKRATGRFFGKILSRLTLGLGYLMIAFTDKKQGMHDLLAKCLVVNKN